MVSSSPLRYPGGKQILTGVLAALIEHNGLADGVYAEPYAGGAGAALSLLFSGRVKRLLLNDVDPCIFSMWDSILNRSQDFVELIRTTPLTIDEWRRQKQIYSSPEVHSALALGFATFFLNRTNRSGIIKNAGPIGGFDQTGPWKIDARFNRAELILRVERIAKYRSRISFTNLDALEFLQAKALSSRAFVYLDPPYFAKGSELYLNHYTGQDHEVLAAHVRAERDIKWVMSYDAAEEIERLYAALRTVRFTLSYSATTRKDGNELLIFGRGVKRPASWNGQFPYELLRAGAA